MTTTPVTDARPSLPDLLAACVEAIAAGDLRAARELADRALTGAVSAGPVAFAGAVLVSGTVHRTTGDLASAQDAFAAAATLASRHLSEPSGARVHACAHIELAALHCAGGRYDEAAQVLRHALDATLACDAATAPEDLALLHNELGIVAGFSGDFDRAVHHYQKALGLLASVLPADHVDLATLWRTIAGLAHARGDVLGNLAALTHRSGKHCTADLSALAGRTVPGF
ncbi:tetratricopeptide repeat protein [Kitasatospora sp. NPDC085879]|uniref:tetratricopeptide repeat protein n=1 Tax=Kitasatospora sp. NPDC085879 TaxID=3154769 RepID=UPI00343468AA